MKCAKSAKLAGQSGPYFLAGAGGRYCCSGGQPIRLSRQFPCLRVREVVVVVDRVVKPLISIPFFLLAVAVHVYGSGTHYRIAHSEIEKAPIPLYCSSS